MFYDNDDYPGRYDNPTKYQLFKFYLKNPDCIWYVIKDFLSRVFKKIKKK